MSKWEKVKLRDVCEINIGKTPSRDNVLFWNNGIYKWLSISDMQDKYLIDSKEKISMEAVGKCNMKLIPINTVVMSFKLSVGKVGILSEPMYSNEAIANFPILNCEKLHANFLYYALQSLKFENMDRAAKGLTLNKAKLNQLKIPLPPLEVQQKIAQTLDSAAALIALRKQQLAELDNLIKAAFYELFGDPVTNEKGWDIERLGDKLSIVSGFAFKSSGFQKSGVPVIKIGNINLGTFTDKEMCFWKYDKKLERVLLHPRDIVISLTGTVGKNDYANVCILPEKYPRYYLNQRNAKLDLSAELECLYLLYLLKDQKIKNQLTGLSRGIRQANISNSDISNLLVPLPPLDLQNQFAEIVTKIEEQKALVQTAIDESQYLFDSLMNEYFN
ncbi:MAG: restriction endonuclease subunit S [Negativicutes bacterium]|nr:restriction endonuclease subunit S [Negativicutes bacterium]